MIRVSRILGAMMWIHIMCNGALASGWNSGGVPLAPSGSAQFHPAIVTDADGGAFVAWSDGRLGPTTTWVQRVTHGGVILPNWPVAGVPALVPQPGTKSHTYPAMTADAEGGVAIASGGEGWYGSTYVGLTRIGSLGAERPSWPVGGVRIFGAGLDPAPAPAPGAASILDVTGVGKVNLLPAVRFEPPGPADHDGSVRVAYSYMRFRGDPNVHVGRIGSGAPAYVDPWPVVTCPGWSSQQQPLICTDGAGGDFVVWALRVQDPAASGVFAQHVQANGTLDSRWPVCGASVAGGLYGQDAAGLTADGVGGFYVAWQDVRNGAFEQTYLQRFKSNGARSDGWPATGLLLSPGASAAGTNRIEMDIPWRESSIAADGEGGVFVAWTDLGRDAGDIRLSRVAAGGTLAPGWPDGGLVVCAASGAQSLPTVATDGGGGLFIAWQDARDAVAPDIYVQHVTAAGAVADGWTYGGDPVTRDPYRQEAPVVVSDGAGDAIVAWVDWRSGSPNIYAGQRRLNDEPVASENRHGARVLGWPHSIAGELSLERAGSIGSAAHTAVRYSIPGTLPAWLRLLDPAGRVIEWHHLAAGAGEHAFESSTFLPAGVYFVQLARGDRAVTMKVVLLR